MNLVNGLRWRLKAWTLFLIGGLMVSGATALPIPTEIAALSALLGSDLGAAGTLPARVSVWLRAVRSGVTATADQAPFMLYGTDWLAFGHFMIALVLVGALRDP